MERIVFAGTPAFALASLKALVIAGKIPVAVYTQPDRRAGRGRKLTASPVKRFALDLGVPVLQPESMRDAVAIDAFADLQPDVLIVAAYGQILPQAVLDVPRHGCLNVHASVLPRWRGAAPIQAALLAGDESTGISLMQMTAGLDTGPVFCDARVAIGTNETAGELHDRLAVLGGELLVDNLDAIVAGKMTPVQQDEDAATYAPRIQKRDAELDWNLSAVELQRRVRAYNPVPGAWFRRGEHRVKVWRADVVDGDASPGSFVQYGRDGIVVACADGALRLSELQAPGKRRAPAHEFVSQLALDQIAHH